MAEEVPLLSNVVEGAGMPEEEAMPEEETPEEEVPPGNMLAQAQHYVQKAEMLATDCEAIAEMVPDAGEHAKEARAAAEEAATGVAAVEAAQTAYDGALATSGSESPEAVQAQRDLEDALRVVTEAYERALNHCDQAKALMPQLETGAAEGEGGLMDWAEQTAE